MVIVIVGDGLNEDYAKSIGRIPEKYFSKLGFSIGEVVEVIARNQRVGIILRSIEELTEKNETPATPRSLFKSGTAWFSENLDKENSEFLDGDSDMPLHINGFLRASLKVSLGQKVQIDKTNSSLATEITVSALTPETRDKIFSDYFVGRPMIKGQIMELYNDLGKDLQVAIVKTSPPGLVTVAEDTHIFMTNDIPKELQGQSADTVMYDHVGGNLEVLSRLRTLVEYPLRYPELFEAFNIQFPQGILITGPPGSGKTYICRAAACEAGVTRFFVASTEMIKGWWEVEESMDKYFDQIIKYEPAIVVLDQIDILAPYPAPTHTDLEKRMTDNLIRNLTKIRGKKIIILGTTTSADLIHPALKVYGRLEIELPLRIPNEDERVDILRIHTRGIPLDADVNLQVISTKTGGYTPADLELLVKTACLRALERLNLLDFDKVRLEEPDTAANKQATWLTVEIKVNQEDFLYASSAVKPSASREVIVQVPKVKWEDIGGLNDVKQSLKEMIEWPIANPQVFKEMNVRMPRGSLLYGPPGTGKTLLAKAIATEIKANFLIVKGPELLSKWYSESARMVRDLFKKAQQLSPCIIFFDEIDALTPKRGGGFSSDASSERDRIINQMLSSLDGIEALNQVYVIGATNRPDQIDPALLRPGRLDRLILVPIPDVPARLQILKVHTRKMQLANDVNLTKVAELTEGYSGADLENLVREAAYAALRENFTARIVNNGHFDYALQIVKASVGPDLLQYYKQMEKQMKNRRVDDYTKLPQEFR